MKWGRHPMCKWTYYNEQGYQFASEVYDDYETQPSKEAFLRILRQSAALNYPDHQGEFMEGVTQFVNEVVWHKLY